jgi:DNA-binding CsgD family transcriptional regulator
MRDDSLGQGRKLSQEFRRYADLYPSALPRLKAILASTDPGVRRRVATLRRLEEAHDEGRRRRFADRYGLTPAEARVALHIIGGGDIASFAKAAGVSPGTVRSQLKAVFAKVGVSRQAELVRLGQDDR